MADRPLRPATHRRLGRPLPHQQANAPRAHPVAEAEASFRPKTTSGISPSFLGLSLSTGQVTHVLLTRSRLCPEPKLGSSHHLHVLSTPPAFVLSQDQTLREELPSERCHDLLREGVHRALHAFMTRFGLPPCRGAPSRSRGVEPGRTSGSGDPGAHAVEFSKTVAPAPEGVSLGRRGERGGSLDGPIRLALLGARVERRRKNFPALTGGGL